MWRSAKPTMAVIHTSFGLVAKNYGQALQKKLAEHVPTLNADLDELVGNLSGGQRQMLNLVIATHLEHEQNPCRLILLDEHTSGLDHANASKVMEFTKTQIEITGTTAIMVTHNYSDAKKYSDRVVVMRDGKITKEFFAADAPWKVEDLILAVESGR
jgi:putative ABC transport system ATP-binding protein